MIIDVCTCLIIKNVFLRLRSILNNDDSPESRRQSHVFQAQERTFLRVDVCELLRIDKRKGQTAYRISICNFETFRLPTIFSKLLDIPPRDLTREPERIADHRRVLRRGVYLPSCG